MLVDLELNGFDGNGDAIVGVRTLIANQGSSLIISQEVGWWYGYKGGTCEANNPYAGIWDAALDLQGDLRFCHIPAPPPGMIRRHELIHTEGPLTPNLPEYRIPDDILDNYMDYRVFFATISVGQIDDDTKCISDAIEMPFYLLEYSDFINEFKDAYSLEFIDCLVEGLTDANETFIQHDFTIFLGDVWFVQSTWVIEDIMNAN